MGEPARVPHHYVELVAMDDEEPLAVGRLVDRLVDHLDAAEMAADIVAQEFVMVSRDIGNLGALACLAQQLLDDVVMFLRPVPAVTQLPSVEDVPYEIERVGAMSAKEVEKIKGLAAGCAQVDVRYPDRPTMSTLVAFCHQLSSGGRN